MAANSAMYFLYGFYDFHSVVSVHNWLLKDPRSDLRQLLLIENPSKMKKNAYFMLKALFFLKILTFLSQVFGYLEKQVHKKAMVDFKTYDATDWTTDNYNTHIAQHLKK